MNNGGAPMDIDDTDELLCEIDIEIRRPEQSVYLFQYPIRPNYRPYDETLFTNVRIKEKYSLVEMDLLIDTQSSNYDKTKGKQFADGTNATDNLKKFFNSDRMDKQTIASSSSFDGSRYFIGLLDGINRRLILCQLKSIVQLRPQFNYLDAPSSMATGTNSLSTRETNSIDDDGMNASDGEQSGSENEENKPEPMATLVTMKFAKKESDYHKKKRLQSYNYYRQMRDEDRWQDFVCVMNPQSDEAEHLRQQFSANTQTSKVSDKNN